MLQYKKNRNHRPFHWWEYPSDYGQCCGSGSKLNPKFRNFVDPDSEYGSGFTQIKIG